MVLCVMSLRSVATLFQTNNGSKKITRKYEMESTNRHQADTIRESVPGEEGKGVSESGKETGVSTKADAQKLHQARVRGEACAPAGSNRPNQRISRNRDADESI